MLFENTGLPVRIVPQPGKHHLGVAIDLCHQAYLLIALWDIRLIHTDGIDPYDCRFLRPLETLKESPQIWAYAKNFAINADDLVGILSPPNIGQSLEAKWLGEKGVAQAALNEIGRARIDCEKADRVLRLIH
jgi:hypothetical protein